MSKVIEENSLDELKKLSNETRLDNLFDKYLKEDKVDETNVSANVSGYSSLVSDIVRNVNDLDDMKYFCSVIESTTPEGRIPVSSATNLVGRDSEDGTASETLRILQVGDVSSFTLGDAITASAGATIDVLFVQDGDANEGKFLLVRVKTGTITTVDTINGEAITNVYNASYMKGQLLTDYADDLTTADGEVADDLNEVEFNLQLIELESTTKKVSTKYTTELMKDLLTTFGKKLKPLLVQGMSMIIRLTNRQKVINYMKTNARVRPNISLPNSTGAQGGIEEIYEGLYARINQSIGAIGTSTGLNGKYTVIGSSNVVSGLKTLLKDKIKMQGNVMMMPHDVTLIEDGYSQDEYLLVALRGNQGDNNSAVIFSPYSYAIVNVTNPIDLQEHVNVFIRSDVKNNKLTAMLNGKNEMMELTIVDGFGDVPNTFPKD